MLISSFDQDIAAGKQLKLEAARIGESPERSALYLQSAQAYSSAAGEVPSTYALINAATLSLLGGDREAAQRHARRVLAMLDSGEHERDTLYWLAATRAEALLVLGEDDAAAEALKAAVALSPRAWEEHAITLRQLRLLLEETGRDHAWLEALRPPPVLAFGGVMGLSPDDETAATAIRTAISDIAPCEGYGALAAGTDILVAEALLATGGDLHVILPAPRDIFRGGSVVPVGEGWGARFDACLDAAISLEVVGTVRETAEEEAPLALELAMGQAIARAHQLETRPTGLHAVANPAGIASLADRWGVWRGHGLDYREIELQRSGPSPRGGSEMHEARAYLAFGGTVESHDDIEAALARARNCDGPAGLAYGTHGALDLLAKALAEADGAPGLRASEYAAYAARMVEPKLDSELAGAVHFEGGMADLYRLYLPG